MGVNFHFEISFCVYVDGSVIISKLLHEHETLVNYFFPCSLPVSLTVYLYCTSKESEFFYRRVSISSACHNVAAV